MENEIENISLTELRDIEGLSIRSKNICEDNRLHDICSIINYYWENENFKKLSNCGNKSNLELIDLCTKYEKYIKKTKIETLSSCETGAILDKINNLTLRQKNILNNFIKSHLDQLSVRASNALKEYLGSNFDIAGMYMILLNKEKEIRKLNNIGKKTLPEIYGYISTITKLIESFTSNEVGSENIKDDIDYLAFNKTLYEVTNKINAINIRQIIYINHLIEHEFNKLSHLSKKSLSFYLNNDITLKSFDEHIFSNLEFEIWNLEYIDGIAHDEIKSLLLSIGKQIDKILEFNNNETEYELLKTTLRSEFSIGDVSINELLKDINLSEGLPLFKIIKFLIDSDIILNNREKIIAYHEFCNTRSETNTISKEVSELGICKERVRQIKEKVHKKFDIIFSFVAKHVFKLLLNYGYNVNENYIEISNDLINEINNSEGTVFNPWFIIRIFRLINCESYELIGLIEGKNPQKFNNFDDFKSYYLVNKHLASLLDFEKLIVDVQKRTSNKIEEDYSLNFQAYLLDFFKTSHIEMLDEISETAEYMIFNEFGISINANECIVFEKNTKTRVIKFIIEALEESGTPLSVYEMYDIIEKKYPEVTTSPESLRVNCQGDPNLFFIGRSSTYGLKKWENESSIKGGTIRDIAEEYLQQHEEPKHIDEITAYISKFRNTNSTNIYSNLHLDKSKRFVFFSGGLIGIYEKKYSSAKYVETKQLQPERKSWEVNFSNLKEFTEDKGRLPSSTGGEDEVRLYRFMSHQIHTRIKKSDDNEKYLLINELLKNYHYERRDRHSNTEWKESY